MILTRLLVLKLMSVYNIDRKNVLGHREAQGIGGVPLGARKTCPGIEFDLYAFRAGLL